jgi:hypothetical protein
MQGWAKRYFVCDKGHLAYFKFEAGLCRGSIPISLSTISIDLDHLVINIDSGSSLWHLRALNKLDFEKWVEVFKRHKAIQAESTKASRSNIMSTSPSNDGIFASAAMESPKSIALDTRVRAFLGELETLVTRIRSSVEDEKLTKKKQSQEDLSLLKMVQDLSVMFANEKQDILDQLDCEASKSKSLQTAYADILQENNQLRMELGKGTVQEYHRSHVHDTRGTNYLHLRAASVTSTASENWFDAEEIVISAAEESSEEDEKDSRKLARNLNLNQEMVIHEEEDEEDDDDDSDYSGYLVGEGDGSTAHGHSIRISKSFSSGFSSNRSPLCQELASQNKSQLTRRNKLPAPMSGDSVSILGILRKNVGKDLSTVSMPINLNEPLNLLQKLAEELEYCELLHRASTCESSLDRLKWVAAFAISGYASTSYRSSRKPFNPLHGETFECVRPDKGFHYIAEKVSHQPPIMACHATASKWIFAQDYKVKSKFWGKSIEFIPNGTLNVTFPDTGDHFTWSKVTTCMRNLIGGPTSLEHYGKMVIINHTTQETAEITFKENGGGGWLGGGAPSKNEVVGALLDNTKVKVASLQGKWNESLFAIDEKSEATELIWKALPPPANYTDYYGFTQFAIELNEITPDLQGKLPPTDTRLRPDQRLFEAGELTFAEAEKLRLEEKQRENRRQLQAEGKSIVPQWFHTQYSQLSGSDEWTYKGGYWEAREKGSWPNLVELW